MNARVELASERLFEVLRSQGDLTGAKVTECISAKENRAVFAGRFAGRPVVFKHFVGEGARMQLASLQAEMTYQWGRMATGDYRVPEPILFVPELGLAIMARVEGERLDRLITADNRAEMVLHSARWLREYSLARRRVSAFSARFWVRRARKLIAHHEVEEDKERAARLVRWMFSQVKILDKREILQLRSHGDFCALNMMYADGVMYGVDLHNQTWLPAAKDVARYLVYLNITLPIATEKRSFGLATDDVDSFLSGFGLLEKNDPLLAFFVASELAGRLVKDSRDDQHLETKRALVDGFFGDVEGSLDYYDEG